MVYGHSIAIGGTLLAIVLSLSVVMFYLSMGPCPSGTFACDAGHRCVPQRQICDKRVDCLDGRDEHPVECGLLFGSKELTNKIVGDAIEKRKMEQQKKQQQQPLGEFRPKTDKDQSENKTQQDSKTVRLLKSRGEHGNAFNRKFMNCEISTYPNLCTCRKRTILYCGSRFKAHHLSKISNEVSNLIINRNSFTLQENAFHRLKHLHRLTLKHNNISTLPAGTFNALHKLKCLDVRYNNVSSLPHGIFDGLLSLQWLFFISNGLQNMTLEETLADVPRLEWLVLSGNQLMLHNEKFPRLKFLYEVYLDSNLIEFIADQTFEHLENLHLLDLSGNRIHYIQSKAFWGLKNIRDIRLIGNPLKELTGEVFQQAIHLDALSLSHTPLRIQRQLLLPLRNVSYLNLTGIRFDRIEFEAFASMLSLKYIVFDRFYFCSMTPQVRMCKPNTDGVSSFSDLLTKPVLRYSAWIMASITLVGNCGVLWGRCIYRDENVAVTIVIRNLAFADMLMGVYLLTIGVQDYRYRYIYNKVALDWITSWQCAAAGALAVTSSEVSMLILAFMSLERFLLIADPFRNSHRLSAKHIAIVLLFIWLLGVGIAVAPAVVWRSSSKFYGTYSGTCFPLHIQEPYPLGWQYSAFMFLGVNLLLLMMIALLYTALLISIWRTRKATPLSLLDCEFAVRFFFIVLTDALCWAPIIAVKIWVFFNYNISDDIYAWLVVFILPLNSAINPLLYTFTTPKYRNQILPRGWKKITARRLADPSNGLATVTATGTATASSQREEPAGPAIPLVTPVH